MSQQPESVRAITDRLDAVGNTTKALTEGICDRIGGPGSVPVVLGVSRRSLQLHGAAGDREHRAAGAVRGGTARAMLVFWFSSLAIKAVGRAAYAVINEVRRQFKEKPASCRARIRQTTRDAWTS